MLSVILFSFSVFVFAKIQKKNVCTTSEQTLFSDFRQDFRVFRQDLKASDEIETFSDKIETCYFQLSTFKAAIK